MSDELREAIIIGLELILFSILLLIIFFFGQYSKNAFLLKNIQDETMYDIVEYRNFYEYTSGSEVDIDVLRDKYNIRRNTSNTLNNLTEEKAKELSNENWVTGDDIVRFVGDYHKEYDVIIQTKENKKIGITKDLDTDVWDVGYVTNWLNDKVSSPFYCFAIYDTYFYKYDSIVFVEKTN